MTQHDNVRVVIYTSVSEFDGNSDGKWSVRSDEYLVAVITMQEAAKGPNYLYKTYVEKYLPVVSMSSLSKAETDNYELNEVYRDWELFYEGELTADEKYQLDMEGYIKYPIKSFVEQT
jgi:hypothetical protein